MTDDVTSKTAKPAPDERLTQLKQQVFDLALQSAIGLDLQSQQALPFVKSLVSEWYSIDDDGEILCNDKTPLGDDFRPLAIENVGVSLRTNHPYLFKSEQSAIRNVPPPKPVQLSRQEMSVEQKARYVQRYGVDALLALPATPVAALPVTEKRRSQMSVQERVAAIKSLGEIEYLRLPA